MTQEQKVYEYMRIKGEISRKEALSLGVYHLAGVIAEMKRKGYRIKTERRRVDNFDGSASYVAYYSLEGGDKDGIIRIHNGR